MHGPDVLDKQDAIANCPQPRATLSGAFIVRLLGTRISGAKGGRMDDAASKNSTSVSRPPHPKGRAGETKEKPETNEQNLPKVARSSEREN